MNAQPPEFKPRPLRFARRIVIYRSQVVWVSLDLRQYMLECPDGHRWLNWWSVKVPGRGWQWMDPAQVKMFSRYWGPGQKVQAPCPECEHAAGHKYRHQGKPRGPR